MAVICASFFLFSLFPLASGDVSIGIMAFPALFCPLFGMYLWHAKKCGIEVLADGFRYGAPDRSKFTTVKWAEIGLYEILPFEEWRSRSFLRALVHSDTDQFEGEKVVLLTLFGGGKVRLMPIYRRQPEFLALLKRMATKAKQK